MFGYVVALILTSVFASGPPPLPNSVLHTVWPNPAFATVGQQNNIPIGNVVLA